MTRHSRASHRLRMTLLQSNDWPGNVRELENVIQSALICTDGESIEPEDLPERFRGKEFFENASFPSWARFERLLREF